MLRTCKVVMLPYQGATHIRKIKEHNILQFYKTEGIGQNDEGQHLYFTSDEEIKEGDWCTDGIGICQIEYIKVGSYKIKDLNEIKPIAWLKGLLKIIATTNPELWFKKADISCTFGSNIVEGEIIVPYLPKIGLDFVEVYVREQAKITEVTLEYEEYPNSNHNKLKEFSRSNPEYLLKPKLRYNGEVIIHQVKEKTYTKKELLAELKAYESANLNYPKLIKYVNANACLPYSAEKWFNERNL